MHMAAPTHKVQSILWPMLEDRCDTRSVSEENDSTMAQVTGLYARSGKLSLSISWGNLLSLVAAFGQVGHVLTALRADLYPWKGERRNPKQLIVSQVGPHLCLQSFVPMTAPLPSPQMWQCC